VRIAGRSTAKYGRFARTTVAIAAAASRQARNSSPSHTQVKIAACQPAKRIALEVERLEQAGAFGLVGGEFSVPAAAGSAYQLGLEKAGFHPTFEFA
jgi:hypothetical protein